MVAEKSPMMGTLVKKMEWLAQRQKVLANNISHADTPQFTPSEIEDFSPVGTKRRRISLAVTNAHHLHESAPYKTGYHVKERKGLSQRDVGNGVILEEELLKASETQSNYVEMLNLYRRNYHMLRASIGRNAG